MGDSRQAFQQLTDLNEEEGRPVFLYLTSTDEEIMPRVETYEQTVLNNEKFCIAAKFFDCFQIDVAELDEENPLRKTIKRPKPMTCYTLSKGKIIYKSKAKPSASQIFSMCSKTLKKVYGVSLDKIAKQEEKILDQLAKVQQEKDQIEKKRLSKGKNLSKREDKKLQMREQELFEEELDLKEKERKLLDLEAQLKPDEENE